MVTFGDRTLYNVPLSIRNNARLGLQARRNSKRILHIPHSYEVATALITGRVNRLVLLKMLQFFKDEIDKKRKGTSATTNDRLLFGGNEGLKFVLAHVKELKK